MRCGNASRCSILARNVTGGLACPEIAPAVDASGHIVHVHGSTLDCHSLLQLLALPCSCCRGRLPNMQPNRRAAQLVCIQVGTAAVQHEQQAHFHACHGSGVAPNVSASRRCHMHMHEKAHHAAQFVSRPHCLPDKLIIIMQGNDFWTSLERPLACELGVHRLQPLWSR